MTRDEQQAVLEHCRRTGTWILADEVYERLYYEPTSNGCAPSFLDISKADDRLVVTHSFSKSFLMTGWRLGWLVLPPAMVDGIGKLIEFNTSCASVFTQRAAMAAIAHTGESHAARGGAPEAVPRHAGAAAGGLAGRAGGAGQGRHVRLLPARGVRRLARGWRSGWWPRPAWGSRRAMPLRPRRRAGCAGASRRRTRSGWYAGRGAAAQLAGGAAARELTQGRERGDKGRRKPAESPRAIIPRLCMPQGAR
jgi:hypothetical protein